MRGDRRVSWSGTSQIPTAAASAPSPAHLSPRQRAWVSRVPRGAGPDYARDQQHLVITRLSKLRVSALKWTTAATLDCCVDEKRLGPRRVGEPQRGGVVSVDCPEGSSSGEPEATPAPGAASLDLAGPEPLRPAPCPLSPAPAHVPGPHRYPRGPRFRSLPCSLPPELRPGPTHTWSPRPRFRCYGSRNLCEHTAASTPPLSPERPRTFHLRHEALSRAPRARSCSEASPWKSRSLVHKLQQHKPHSFAHVLATNELRTWAEEDSRVIPHKEVPTSRWRSATAPPSAGVRPGGTL